MFYVALPHPNKPLLKGARNYTNAMMRVNLSSVSGSCDEGIEHASVEHERGTMISQNQPKRKRPLREARLKVKYNECNGMDARYFFAAVVLVCMLAGTAMVAWATQIEK